MANLALTPAKLDVVAERGKTWTVNLRLPEDTDLSGFHVRWQMRTSLDAASPTLDFSDTTQGITIADNIITLTVPATATALLSVGRYVHGFELIEPSGSKPPFISGNWSVESGAVR